MSQFKAGDVVKLKSGGLAMTIRGAAAGVSGQFICDWFDTDNKPNAKTFKQEQLKLVDDSE